MTRDIVDSHHHLWDDFGTGDYLLDDLAADAATVPSDVGIVTQTVFIECKQWYRTEGPDHLRPVGETAAVAALAAAGERRHGVSIAGIIGRADLELPLDQLDEVLDGHVRAGDGRFRGIRDALTRAPAGLEGRVPGRKPAGRALDPDFQRGVARLGERGLTYESWHYHTQAAEFLALARAVPGTTMIVDHLSTPLAVASPGRTLDEVFPVWAEAMRELATCENVVCKIGGLAVPELGFGWRPDEPRPHVDAFIAAKRRWYEEAIDAFGPARCMFESNYPVDRAGVRYSTFWEAAARVAASYTEDEQAMLFAGTARRVYGLS